MRAPCRLFSAFCLALVAGALPLAAQQAPLRPQAAVHPDHHEFEAMLFAPFNGERGMSRTFRVAFTFPDAAESTWASWRLELVNGAGETVRRWHGETPLVAGRGLREIPWDGRGESGVFLKHGFYTLRLQAAPTDELAYRTAPGGGVDARVEPRLAAAAADLETQEATLLVGRVPAPKVTPMAPLPVGARQDEARAQALAGRDGEPREASRAATASLPYTIYFGNMHSQTNHSDGGTPVGSCGGAETPQGGVQGPTEAFEMMRVQAGGDFLLASEHNHMYDGSTSENTSADTVAARNLWQSGQALASSYRAAHPGFMALYGNEWGVITNGGHMNLLNPDGLATWEHGAGGLLTGDYYVPKSDYAAMYALMKARGWVGQFNHPKTSTQFLIGGTSLGYSADGAEVMALCEIMNTSAFSTNTTETETGHSSYTGAWNILLERGYHVAPTTDQDNHCANWGLSFRNRTGVLVPTGTALTLASFIDAVKARRVFATEDKAGQLILTANGHVMGETFANSGSLTLTANYASTSGQTATRVQFFEGVPGRNGTVTQLAEGSDTHAFTPANGEHFYYALVTQANGDRLWSAPVWVSQGGTPTSTVTASITSPAANLTIDSGTSVSFAGSATSSAGNPLTYGWTFGDGGSAAGAAASHTFTNGGATAANYTVTFTANDGAATGTATRVITVNPATATNTAPTVSAIGNQTTAQDTATGPIAFTVGDAETAAGSLTLAGTSSNTALVPVSGLVFGGSGSARTLTITPAAGQSGTATITVTTTDGGGLTASTAFTLTVTAAAAGGSLIISQYYEGLNSDKWIEVTNVGTGTVNLASPQRYLALFSNAAADAPSGVAPTSSLALTGSLAPGASLLFKNSASVNPSYAVGTASGVINFNGDDLVILSAASGTTAWAGRLDVVGDGSTWGTDKSFVRKASVLAGNATWTPAEWTQATLAAVDGAAAGTSERLGAHLFGAANTVTAAITAPAADLTVASGAMVNFAGTGTDSSATATLGYAWTFGDGATATGATASHAFSNGTASDQVRNVTFTVSDETGASATATRIVTVTPGPDTTAPTATASEAGTDGVITLSATASDDRGVSNVEFLIDGVLAGSDATAPYGLAYDSAALANGSHSLVARATDAAGNVGTSAPVAFTISHPDTVAPTVSAGESGTAGTITLSATASDNVGVARVEFSVDGALKGTDATSPYGMTLDSTTLANGTHSLTAQAFDAAGNSATSAPVAFTINNPVVETQVLQNPGFESGAVNWTATAGVITSSASRPAHAGSWKAWLNGRGTANTQTLYQQVAIPGTATSANLAFWVRIDTAETTTTQVWDTLKVQVRNSSGALLATLATYSNLNKNTTYLQKTFSLLPYKGQTVRVHLEGKEDGSLQTSFVLDDFTLLVK